MFRLGIYNQFIEFFVSCYTLEPSPYNLYKLTANRVIFTRPRKNVFAVKSMRGAVDVRLRNATIGSLSLFILAIHNHLLTTTHQNSLTKSWEMRQT